jgi:peptidoglycan hydrolase-like protein with peptidoglycan-binding domain
MADEFIGDPAPLRDRDYRNAADSLGCSVAAIRAVAEVESSGGGFLPDGRPKLLYERHVFHARTRGRFGAAYPALSSPQRGGYLGGAREYDRLAAAIALDRKAALESASWGKFQVMGFNAGLAGYADVERFVAAMVSGEPAQLAAFVAFIKACKLDGALVRGDWAAFARGYNGSAFAQNGYDRKIAAAHARFAGNDADPLLRLGDNGTAVSRLQALIGQAPDGVFGRDTHTRVIALQRQAGLSDDGVVGPRTWAWLRRPTQSESDPAQVT